MTQLPLHSRDWPSRNSRYDILEDEVVRTDPATAHEAAGDAALTLRIPDSCNLCHAVALAETQAEVARSQAEAY